MLDTKQLKNVGLRFARTFQMAIRTAVLFSAEHPNVQRPVQQSFDLLNGLMKESGRFTVGFVDSQIVLNNLLTTDPSLDQLNKEFLKRGIAAVTFEPGLTMARYRKLIGLVSASSKVIDEAGGLRLFIEQNEVEGTRILLAAKNQKKNEQGDTILETNSEAYILSKQMEEDPGSRDFMDSVDALLESACLDPSARNAILSGMSGLKEQGYGVPIPMPNLVVAKDGEADASSGSAGPGQGPGGGEGAGTGEGGTGTGTGAPGSTGSAGQGPAVVAVDSVPVDRAAEWADQETEAARGRSRIWWRRRTRDGLWIWWPGLGRWIWNRERFRRWRRFWNGIWRGQRRKRHVRRQYVEKRKPRLLHLHGVDGKLRAAFLARRERQPGQVL